MNSAREDLTLLTDVNIYNGAVIDCDNHTHWNSSSFCYFALYQPLFSNTDSGPFDAPYSISCAIPGAHVTVEQRVISAYRSAWSFAARECTQSRSVAITRKCLSAFATTSWSQVLISVTIGARTCNALVFVYVCVCVCVSVRITFYFDLSQSHFNGPLRWWLQFPNQCVLWPSEHDIIPK